MTSYFRLCTGKSVYTTDSQTDLNKLKHIFSKLTREKNKYWMNWRSSRSHKCLLHFEVHSFLRPPPHPSSRSHCLGTYFMTCLGTYFSTDLWQPLLQQPPWIGTGNCLNWRKPQVGWTWGSQKWLVLILFNTEVSKLPIKPFLLGKHTYTWHTEKVAYREHV